MFTIQFLKLTKPETIFACGETIDAPNGVNMMNTGKQLRWIACKGRVNDWALYVGEVSHSYKYIQQYGDKVYSEEAIRKLVLCDDEFFKAYRY